MIDVVIAEHYGKIFGEAGDSVIAEFGSPIKASECAVQMQGMNENAPQNQRMNFRIRRMSSRFETYRRSKACVLMH